MHRDRILGMNFLSSGRWNIRWGGRWNSTMTCEVFLARLLPERRKNGTPFQRQLSMKSLSTANVGVCELGATPSDCWYPSYCARTVSVRVTGRMEDSSLKT